MRHGATEWSELGKHTGRTDPPLLPLGLDQARRVGTLLQSLLFEPNPLVFTSPMERAMATAYAALPNVEVTVSDALREFDYGSYEGLTSEEINVLHPGWNLFADGVPSGDGLAQVTARCDSFLAKLERVAVGRSVVVFTHGHLSRILTARLLGLPVSMGRSLENTTGSVGSVVPKRGELVLDGWNLRPLLLHRP